MTQLSTNFADVLSPLFQQVWDDAQPREESMIPKLYKNVPTNGRNDMRFSSVGTLPDMPLFNGEVNYRQFYQGYDTVLTPLEFAEGFTVERKLYDDDQYAIFNDRPRQLREADWRTREGYGARQFNMGFAVDTFFYVNSEGVSLFSNSHTTTVPGVSTSIGFDNRMAAALSVTAVQTAYILASEFRGDQAEIMSVRLDTLLIPPNLYAEAHEITQSAGNPLDGTNRANVSYKAYDVWAWQYLRDASATNWFLLDSRRVKECLMWTDRVSTEFGSTDEFDTLQAKFRAYTRYGNAHIDWRCGIGSEG